MPEPMGERDHRVGAAPQPELHGDRIARPGERLAQGDVAEELTVVVARAGTTCPSSEISRDVSGTIAFGGIESRMARAYTNGLNDEPGWRIPLTARLKGDS